MAACKLAAGQVISGSMGAIKHLLDGAGCTSGCTIVLAGGTATTAAALSLHLKEYSSEVVHLSRITASRLDDMAASSDWLHDLPDWLQKSRATNLPAGCFALSFLMKVLHNDLGVAASNTFVSDADILDGLLAEIP